MTALQRRLLQLDLRSKLTAALVLPAIALGGIVFLTEVALTRHLLQEHGQDLHLFEFLLPLFAGIGLLVIIGLVFLARFMARLISTPLLEVAAAAEQIAASGRPTGRLQVAGADEFGRLAAAFNTMIDRLAGSYADLEQRVAERTREYEESQHEAQRASNLLREAVQSIAQGFTIYDEHDRLILCNETYRNFYEASRDLIVPGNTFEHIVRTGAERGQYEAALGNIDAWVEARVRQHQEASGQVIEQQLGDGRWLMIVEYRTPSGYIVGNRIDITALKEATRRIQEHSEQLNAIFDLSPDGFIAFDQDRRIKYASPAFTRMTGIPGAEIIGLDEDAFSGRLAAACNPDARFTGLAPLRHAQKVGAGGTASDTPPRRNLIELGTAGMRILDIGLRESQAATVSQILYLRDVTHETEVDRMKSEFLSTSAHELRTPMASIYGFTELLLNQEFSPGEQRDFLNTIYQQSSLMISIINELLDLARIEARRGKDFNIGRYSLCQLTRDVVSGFKPPVDRPPPTLTACPTPCWVNADPKKLAQAVGNVLSNAYKYSPNGGPVEIDMVFRREEEQEPAQTGIAIRDHGIGMTPEQLARVFERFYRADTSGKIPGTGLGMSIVKEIIELHGGRIDIASQFGTGTQVTLWLPAVTGEAQS